MHGYPRGHADVDRAGRTELGDLADDRTGVLHLGRQPWSLLTEHERTSLRKSSALQRYRSRQHVDADQWEPGPVRPRDEPGHVLVVVHVLIPVGHHRPPPVPSALADDVDRGGQERVGVADHRADVEVVLPVLDRDVERMTAGVEIGHDGLTGPVSVSVDNVAPVPVAQQLGIEAGVVRPGVRMGPDADFALAHPVSLSVASARSSVARVSS